MLGLTSTFPSDAKAKEPPRSGPQLALPGCVCGVDEVQRNPATRSRAVQQLRALRWLRAHPEGTQSPASSSRTLHASPDAHPATRATLRALPSPPLPAGLPRPSPPLAALSRRPGMKILIKNLSPCKTHRQEGEHPCPHSQHLLGIRSRRHAEHTSPPASKPTSKM